MFVTGPQTKHSSLRSLICSSIIQVAGVMFVAAMLHKYLAWLRRIFMADTINIPAKWYQVKD